MLCAMRTELLRRFEPLAALEWSTLSSVARHARLVRLADQRTLAPSRRMARGNCYLLRGTVRRRAADGSTELVRAADPRARLPLLVTGDGAALDTVGAVALIWIDLDPVEFLLGAVAPTDYAVELGDDALDDDWMHRLLRAGFGERLAPVALQALFRAFEPTRFEAGAAVVAQGDAAERFYVLASGSAEVHRGASTVIGLKPGDAFGADALICGRRRNASVTMRTAGRVMTLQQRQFDALVAAALVRWCDGDRPGLYRIDLSQRPHSADGLRRLVAELDLGGAYQFVGGTTAERSLAAFLASQRGITAFARRELSALQAATVRPRAQLRSDSIASPRTTDIG
jgi:CRP-like cAMP-binding protein